MAKSTVLVTGASYGLGYALALEAAKAGNHVLALGRTQGSLDELADAIDETDGNITIVPMDITDDGAIDYLAASITERWGTLDYWLHTAWFTAPMQPVSHLIAKDLDKAYQTNVRATARLIALLEPLMRQGKAVFFNQDGLDNSFMSNICTSKIAQIQLAKTWAKESEKLGPKVEIYTPTPFFSNLSSTLYPGLKHKDLSSPAVEAKKIWAQIQAG